MRYRNIGEAIAGVMDQTARGMTSHEYELHVRRLKRYAGVIEECEDALTCFSDDEKGTAQYSKWASRLAKYQTKLTAERSRGL